MHASKLTIVEEKENYIHYSSPVSTLLTLCGWVDVDYDEVEDDVKVTCPTCLSVVKFCKKIKLAQRK